MYKSQNLLLLGILVLSTGCIYKAQAQSFFGEMMDQCYGDNRPSPFSTEPNTPEELSAECEKNLNATSCCITFMEQLIENGNTEEDDDFDCNDLLEKIKEKHEEQKKWCDKDGSTFQVLAENIECARRTHSDMFDACSFYSEDNTYREILNLKDSHCILTGWRINCFEMKIEEDCDSEALTTAMMEMLRAEQFAGLSLEKKCDPDMIKECGFMKDPLRKEYKENKKCIGALPQIVEECKNKFPAED